MNNRLAVSTIAYGMLFATRKTIPYLKQLGVADRDIHAITVENPRRFFGGV